MQINHQKQRIKLSMLLSKMNDFWWLGIVCQGQNDATSIQSVVYSYNSTPIIKNIGNAQIKKIYFSNISFSCSIWNMNFIWWFVWENRWCLCQRAIYQNWKPFNLSLPNYYKIQFDSVWNYLIQYHSIDIELLNAPNFMTVWMKQQFSN